jgi:hypothetical protein
MDITIFDAMIWSQNKLYNPITKHKIKLNGKIYNSIEQKYNEFFPNKYSYIDSIEDRDVISFELFWVETNGIKKMVYKNMNDLILYQDIHNTVHCFEKKSLEYMKHYNILNHPITNELLPSHIFNNINVIEQTIDISDQAKNTFNQLTNISIFIDSNLFMKLNNRDLDKLYYETREFYLENIPDTIRSNLTIFTNTVNKYNNLNVKEKQIYILDCFDKLLNYTPQLYIANYIIVGGLSIVIPEIKHLYPDIVMNF